MLGGGVDGVVAQREERLHRLLHTHTLQLLLRPPSPPNQCTHARTRTHARTQRHTPHAHRSRCASLDRTWGCADLSPKQNTAFIGIDNADVSGDVPQLRETEVFDIEGGSGGGTESDFILRKQRQREEGESESETQRDASLLIGPSPPSPSKR